MDRAHAIRKELAEILPHAEAAVRAAGPQIAVLLPCHNEEVTIANVIASFAAALPQAKIYVYDNASTDRTTEMAIAAGGILRRENLRGKGNVVRRMFADIEADIYILADGDETYDASAAGALVERLISHELDMVVGARIDTSQEAYRSGHRLGNKLFNAAVAGLFGPGFSDIFSGYRVFSRRFVKSFPAVSAGFEIEAELTTHALDLRLPTEEVPVNYRERPENSKSKLNTYRDGLRIMWAILRIYQASRPMRFFGGVGIALAAISLAFGAPIVVEFLRTGLVPRFPTAILAAALMQLSWLCIACGIIIQAISRMRREMHRMHYLGLG
jgi:glycosyltransferase involved in cell wall biosynthesis